MKQGHSLVPLERDSLTYTILDINLHRFPQNLLLKSMVIICKEDSYGMTDFLLLPNR